MSDVWAALSAISAALGVLLVIVASVYAHIQVKEARRSRHITLLLAFQENYHSISARDFRRWLLAGEFGMPEEFDADKLDRENFHRFWQLLDQLEVLGVLVKQNLIDFELVVASFHRSPPMVWEAIGPYVQKRRREASPLESVNLEHLVHRYRSSDYLPREFWDRIAEV
ncbi:hypothetical protein [Microbispora sp. H10949]|uniref:DUF4760 domain-containing protein n=1 Tax=Microbispora sp. H10949 TaxID=2729111 RepID=UPI001601EC30|nr:hypothetical protein [Microbispora sp. H10949]